MTKYHQNQVKEALQDTKEDVARLLDFFQMELDKINRKEASWPTVGSLTEVRKQLIETLSFMSGFKTEEIENTLLEAMEDK